ncbi:MAG: hypothetical protein MSA07_01270 [Mucispirillum sp.]|nr:hypothetical protein [Mucispirillum sp.]
MNKLFLKYIILTMAAAFMLTGCLEENEVRPPVPYVTESATKIDLNNKTTFNGNYSVASFTKSQDNNIAGINTLAGGFVLNYNNNEIQYNYALKYGGYNNTSAQLMISNNNTVIQENDIQISEDGYTITFNTPITYEADGVTYTINSIKKNDDNLIVITENIDVDSFISTLTKLCDPLLPIDSTNVKTCGESGAMNYVGYYRIDNITCGGTTYVGGVNFIGEMTASADLTYLSSQNKVSVPIATKFQVINNDLKSCILTQNEINNSNLYFEENNFNIDLTTTGGFSSSIFANVGLVAIREGNEQDRTSYITYEPKNTDYTDILFNNNIVTMKLRIMQQRNPNDLTILKSPVTLTNETYFTIDNTGM